MDAETVLTCRRRAQRRRLVALWLVLAPGCFAQKPSGESAPTAPGPTPAAPEPEHEPEHQPEASPVLAPQLSREPRETKKREAAPPVEDAAPANRSRPAAAPAKPAAKPQSGRAAGAAESERALGGSRDGVEPDATALRQRLDRAYRAGSPDCPSARDRRKAVCDLATQICQLTDRDPNVASVAEYCSEAKARCSEAARRTEERCPD